MAKLSAHGTEVARITYRATIADSPYEVHLSFRSDGHIMRRLVGLDVHPNASTPALRRHDYGWKLYKRLADHKRDTVRRLKAMAHAASAAHEAKGNLLDFKMSGGPYA